MKKRGKIVVEKLKAAKGDVILPSSSDKKQRTTKPVAPENSALADELRSQLKGKPTRCGFNRSWKHEIFSFIGDIVRVFVVAVLCLFFVFGGFGAGMLLGYASTTKPLSIGDLTSAEESQTSFVYDGKGNVIAKLTGAENVDRIYVSYSDLLQIPRRPCRQCLGGGYDC